MFKNTEDNLLLESGIKLPKDTKAVKIVTHKDFDGFFSALVTYNQLQKQGIDKKNITINFIQYGDEESEMLKKIETHGKQASVVLDFAAFPQRSLYDEIKKITDYKFKDYILEKRFFEYIKKAVKGNIENKKGFIDFTRKTFEIPENKNLEEFYTLFRQFKPSSIGKKFDKKDYKVSLANPDFLSDHHYDDKGKLVKGKSGSIKKEFKSDTEHITMAYAPNIMDLKDVAEVSKMDSASFTRLEDNFELPKNFKKQGRLERLAILTKTFVEDAIKSDPEVAKELIRVSSPSLVSVYSNFIKLYKHNATKNKVYNELVKENPNWEMIDSLRSSLPERLKATTSKEDLKGTRKFKSRKEWIDYAERNLAKAKTGYLTKEEETEETEKAESKIKDLNLYIRTIRNYIENYKKDPVKNKEEIKKYETNLKEYSSEIKQIKKELEEKLSKKKGQFQRIGNTMRQDATSLKDYPSRYLGSALNIGGARSLFNVKRFNAMIQISLNPDAPEDLKKEVDLAAVANKVLKETRKKYETFSNKWAFELIEDASGGHKAITTFSKLNLLGLLKKKDRDRLKELEALNKRAKATGSSLKDISEKAGAGDRSKWNELKHLYDMRDEAAKQRVEILNYMEELIQKELSVYKGVVTKKQSDYKKYEMNESVLEDIVRELL
jgi:hypothetical protein